MNTLILVVYLFGSAQTSGNVEQLISVDKNCSTAIAYVMSTPTLDTVTTSCIK